MTDERAKEIAETIRAQHETASPNMALPVERDLMLLHLYDEIQAIKASMGGLAFLSGGIQPVRKIDG